MTTQIQPYNILIICDDNETGLIWSFALRQRGVEARLVTLAQQALDVLKVSTFDLVLVDICSYQLNGLMMCQKLRKDLVIPILLLDVNPQDYYILATYNMGVDEYILKPVSPSILMVKIHAWLKRTRLAPIDSLETLCIGPFLLDPFQRQLIYEGKQVFRLTHLEFRLLHLLMSHHGKTLKSNFILNYVWGAISEGDHLLLKNLIYRLRQKLEPNPKRPIYIYTDLGLGYRFGPIR